MWFVDRSLFPASGLEITFSFPRSSVPRFCRRTEMKAFKSNPRYDWPSHYSAPVYSYWIRVYWIEPRTSWSSQVMLIDFIVNWFYWQYAYWPILSFFSLNYPVAKSLLILAFVTVLVQSLYQSSAQHPPRRHTCEHSIQSKSNTNDTIDTLPAPSWADLLNDSLPILTILATCPIFGTAAMMQWTLSPLVESLLSHQHVRRLCQEPVAQRLIDNYPFYLPLLWLAVVLLLGQPLAMANQ